MRFIMKRVLSVIILLCFGVVMIAQQGLQMREVNPDYLEYISKKNSGEIESKTSEGYYLGEIPSPIIRDYSNLQVSTPKSLPAVYDLRDVDGGAYLTPVKDQGLEGACWAFATYAAVESYWKKQSWATFDLSEQNLATCHGFDWTPSEGGNSDLSTAYLSRRSGPVSENDDEYTLPLNPSCVSGLTPVAYVGEARYLPGMGDANYSADIIKQAIMDNGVLYINMRFDGDYMNYSDKTYYYNGTENTNHGVAIVGWDNSKTVTGGSAATPASQGAWIIKNSWGPSWGEAGYFYISYEDTKALTTVAYFPSNIDYNADSEIYYYDEFGALSGIGYGDGDDYGLVKYIASDNQQITMVGTYINDAGTDVTIEIYDNFSGGTLSNLLGTTDVKSCTYPGYYTFNLLSPVNIANGNDFYIKARYNSGNHYTIPIEIVYDGFASSVSIETGVCWLSDNGDSWEAIGGSTSWEYDLCLKAYAVNIATAIPVADFTADNTTVTVDQTVYFSDASTGIPDDWTWTFEGGTPSSSNSPNPTVTWATAGTYNVTLTVSNIMGNDEVIKNDYITVTNSPIVCEYHSNIGDTEANVYYSTSGGFITGVNNHGFIEFAEFYDSHINNLIEGARLYVAKADVYSADAKITMKIWDVVSGKPGAELYSEDFDISVFTPFAYNEVSFAYSTTVPDEFFIGYQVYYTTPQDTFAVLQAANRGASPTFPTTAFIKYSGTWNNIDNIFQGDFNSSFAIAPHICPSPPTASFIADVTTGCDNLTVQFTNQSSANTDSWLWDFGDGAPTNSETNPVHTYNAPGTYTVSLTATNTIGSDVFEQIDLIVLGATPNPVTVSGGNTQCGGAITLTANGGDGGTIYFQGTTSGGENTLAASASEIISTSGTYYFRSQSAEGCWGDEGSASVTINTIPDPVTVTGGGTQCGGTIALTANGGDGGNVYFQGTTSGGESTLTPSVSEIISTSGTYYFRSQSAAGCWGDEGSASVTIHPELEISLSTTHESVSGANDGTITVNILSGTPDYIYNWAAPLSGETSATITELTGGTYCITVTDGNGCEATDCEIVNIDGLTPVANFTADVTEACDNLTVTFTDASSNTPTSWTWTFGDGGTSDEQNPIHEYTTSGLYSVSLIAGNTTGDNEIIKADYIAIGETPEINYIVTPATAEFAADGAIFVSVSGGAEPYSVLWNHDAMETSLELTNLVPNLYYITVTESFNCTQSKIIEVNWVSSVVNLTSSFSMYPNPTKNRVTIVSDNEPILNLTIVNVLGQVVYEHIADINTEQFTFGTKDFASGTYFIKVEFNDGFAIQKLVKR